MRYVLAFVMCVMAAASGATGAVSAQQPRFDILITDSALREG